MTAPDLRAWRLRLGLSRAEAAAALRTSVRTYEAWEGGRPPAVTGPLSVACEAIERERTA